MPPAPTCCCLGQYTVQRVNYSVRIVKSILRSKFVLSLFLGLDYCYIYHRFTGIQVYIQVRRYTKITNSKIHRIYRYTGTQYIQWFLKFQDTQDYMGWNYLHWYTALQVYNIYTYFGDYKILRVWRFKIIFIGIQVCRYTTYTIIDTCDNELSII